LNITTFCINRPAFTIVISLVLVIVGILGYHNLNLRWIPNVNSPEVTVMTTYPGANARIVEKDITKVIEEAMSGVNGVENMTSSTHQGSSQVHIKFQLGRNMNAAVEDVRSNVERVRDSLPKDASSPLVIKANPNTNAIMYLSFYDTNRSEREISDYVDKFIVPVFETMDGVGSVFVWGKRITAMRVWLDPAKMAASRITVTDVVDLLREQNISIPSGQIHGQDRIYNVTTSTELKGAEQFNNLILRGGQTQMVRLKDVGEAMLDPESTDDAFRVNGHTAIAIGIIPQSTANPLDIETNVKKAFHNIVKSLPAGMHAEIAYNQADYIRASIKSVYESFIEAILFVWLVILVFLCSFRATLVPIITIPVCLVSSFAILYFFGFSINTITLMAFVLAIGLVVDDAIVMLENISRHIEHGMTPYAAAVQGSKEMIFPIIAMTLTLAAVYAPIAFTPGLLGVIFREFTFTLAGAVVISGIIALTLSPMMCARILKKPDNVNRYAVWFTSRMERLQLFYKKILEFILDKRKWVTAVLFVIGLLGVILYHYLPSELAPQEDMGEIDVSVVAPRSSSFTYTDTYARQLEKIYASIPDVKSFFSVSGYFSSSHAFQEIQLKPKNERKQSTAATLAQLKDQTKATTGVNVHLSLSSPPLARFAGSEAGDNIELAIMSTSDYRQLQQISQRLMDELKTMPQFTYVDNKLKWDSEEFEINIDRNKAADLKVPISSIGSTISFLLASRTIGKTEDANIIVQMKKSSLADPNIFSQLYVRNSDADIIPLSQFASVKTISAPEVFHRYMRLHADTIYITLAPGIKLADAVTLIEKTAKATLPDDARFEFKGEAKSFLESNGATLLTFGLAILFIYLVLVAQFESFIDPLVILFTVPFAVFGALLTLHLFGGTLNVYSNIGLITLIGLIAKHGILITEFANRMRADGMDIHAAVIHSAMLRLRPILMTTSAMILGALPLAVAFGPGAESRQQVGLVITGGLLFGTFFSLIVIPVMYTYLAPLKRLSTTVSDEGHAHANAL
jgi:multidrug efflux pump